VVMGVSGCGKSTLGLALAHALSLRYVEGDVLHPPENVQRMAAGIALTDDDRAGWLAALAQALREARDAGAGVVVSCSALKRAYRDVLRGGATDLRLVHLHGDAQLLKSRMTARPGHYMPASLLQSQLQTLEVPSDEENPIRVNIALPPSDQLQRALQVLNTTSL
jgi:gluconokinase